MEIYIAIISILGTFITAFLAYLFAVKKSKKDIDIEKQRVLNNVLADMLLSRFYLTRLSLMDQLLSDTSANSIFPRDCLPTILLNSGVLKKECFSNLDESIQNLKQYDAITYYELEGIGDNMHHIQENFIKPMLQIQTEEAFSLSSNSIKPILKETIEDIETNILSTAKKLGNPTVKDVNKLISKPIELESSEIIKKTEEQYFKHMAPLISPNSPLSREEFAQFATTADFKTILELQIAVLNQGNLKDSIDLIKNNPSASIEEITHEIQNNSDLTENS